MPFVFLLIYLIEVFSKPVPSYSGEDKQAERKGTKKRTCLICVEKKEKEKKKFQFLSLIGTVSAI